jgi:hypothetical protein
VAQTTSDAVVATKGMLPAAWLAGWPLHFDRLWGVSYPCATGSSSVLSTSEEVFTACFAGEVQHCSNSLSYCWQHPLQAVAVGSVAGCSSITMHIEAEADHKAVDHEEVSRQRNVEVVAECVMSSG